MEKNIFFVIIFVINSYWPNYALAQAPDWMQGTWIGIGYQPNQQNTRKIILKGDNSSKNITILYANLDCEAKAQILFEDHQKAKLRQKMSSPDCAENSIIILTRISSDYITYSNFDVGNGELIAYATLIKVDQELVSINESIKMENLSCNHLYFDLEKGTLNGIKLEAAQAEIKKALPCFTGDTPDGVEYNCGGGVFYLDHHVFFYSGQDYIEVRNGFTGELSIDVMGKSPQQVIKELGDPGRRESVRKWDGTQRVHYFYPKSYGCLSMVFVDNELVKIAAHRSNINETQLCY